MLMLRYAALVVISPCIVFLNLTEPALRYPVEGFLGGSISGVVTNQVTLRNPLEVFLQEIFSNLLLGTVIHFTRSLPSA